MFGMFSFLYSILLDPESEGGSEGGTETPPATTEPKTADPQRGSGGEVPPQKIKIGDEEYTPDAIQQAMNRMEQRWAATQTLMDPTADRDVQEKAIRYLGQEVGYSKDYIESLVSGGEPAQEKNVNSYGEDDPYEGKNGQKNQNQNSEYETLKQKVEEQERAINEQRVREMNQTMNASLEKALASKEISSLLEGVKEDKRDEVRGFIEQDIQAAARDSLRRRASQAKNFDVNWIKEEVDKAGENTHNKWRAVISSRPGALSGGEETGSPESEFLQTEPVKPARWQGGEKRAEAIKGQNNYILDALKRAAASSNQGKQKI